MTDLVQCQRARENVAVVTQGQVRGHHLSRGGDRLDEGEYLLHQVLLALPRSKLCRYPRSGTPAANCRRLRHAPAAAAASPASVIAILTEAGGGASRWVEAEARDEHQGRHHDHTFSTSLSPASHHSSSSRAGGLESSSAGGCNRYLGIPTYCRLFPVPA